MALIAGAIIGSVVGAYGSKEAARKQSNAANEAAKTQAASEDKAAQLQYEQFNRQVQLQEPFRQAGLAGQNRLMTLLGITPQPSNDMAALGFADPTAAAVARQVSDAVGGTQAVTGAIGAATRDPRLRQANPVPGTSVATQGEMGPLGPGVPGWRQANPVPGTSVAALGEMGIRAPNQGTLDLQSSSDFGKYARDFGMQDFQNDPGSQLADFQSYNHGFNLQNWQDPGYGFRLSEGLKALDRQAAAKGGLISGAALKASQNYGQEAASNEYQNAFNRFQVGRNNASNEYQNAFNRYQTSRAAQLNPLQSLAGQAQSSANTIGQAGQAMAAGVGNAYTGAANAMAAGYTGAANANAAGTMGTVNALSGGIGQYMNYKQNQQYLDLLNNKSSYTSGYNDLGFDPYANP